MAAPKKGAPSGPGHVGQNNDDEPNELFDICEAQPNDDQNMHATNAQKTVGETLYDDMAELEGKQDLDIIDDINNAAIASDDTLLVADINHLHSHTPGAPSASATAHTPGISGMPQAASTTVDMTPNDDEKHEDLDELYIDSIQTAVSELQSEIGASEQERKQNEMAIEQQLANMVRHIAAKKVQLLQQMNTFYNDQRTHSMNRIVELQNEMIEQQRALQEKRKRQRNERMEAEQKRKQHQIMLIGQEMEEEEQEEGEEEEKSQPMSSAETGHRRTSSSGLAAFGSLLKEQASKAKASMKDVVKAIGRGSEQHSVPRTAEYVKHDKLRLYIASSALSKLIESDIGLSSEWWDVSRLNHVYVCREAELWRTSHGGWYNAFGTKRVRKGQRNRWNVRICERRKVELKNGTKPPAEVVLGVVPVDTLQQAVTKESGFWLNKAGDGFAIYGWNGKVFHGRQNGTMYCKPIHAGSTIGIELDLRVTPGKQADRKSSVPVLFGSSNGKVNSNAYSKTVNADIGKHGGVIKFYEDGKDLGVAFYEIDMDRQYALAVAMKSAAYTLQLID